MSLDRLSSASVTGIFMSPHPSSSSRVPSCAAWSQLSKLNVQGSLRVHSALPSRGGLTSNPMYYVAAKLIQLELTRKVIATLEQNDHILLFSYRTCRNLWSEDYKCCPGSTTRGMLAGWLRLCIQKTSSASLLTEESVTTLTTWRKHEKSTACTTFLLTPTYVFRV